MRDALTKSGVAACGLNATARGASQNNLRSSAPSRAVLVIMRLMAGVVMESAFLSSFLANLIILHTAKSVHSSRSSSPFFVYVVLMFSLCRALVFRDADR